MSNNIEPVQNTNNIRIADFVRVTTPDAVYRFATTPAPITVPAVDSQPFTAVGLLAAFAALQRHGPVCWQRPHSVQLAISNRPFQEISALFPIPKMSSSFGSSKFIGWP